MLALKPTGVVLLPTNDLEEALNPLSLPGTQTDSGGTQEVRSQVAGDPVPGIPVSENGERPAEKIKELNKLYAAAVKGDAQVTFKSRLGHCSPRMSKGNAKAADFPDPFKTRMRPPLR